MPSVYPPAATLKTVSPKNAEKMSPCFGSKILSDYCIRFFSCSSPKCFSSTAGLDIHSRVRASPKKDSWMRISLMQMHLIAFRSVEEDITNGELSSMLLSLLIVPHKTKFRVWHQIDSWRRKRIGKEREEELRKLRRRSRSVLRHYSAQPIRFPWDDVSQEQLARQQFGPFPFPGGRSRIFLGH